ncbi:MAG: hypothetical protein GTO03_12725 [Planctomycetales bacterium]|nr:hypothetical protein [Planctomycetales bacterium]
MEDLVQAASSLQSFCVKRHWNFCFIGGLALQYWGRPRLTQDVDLCLLTGFGNEDAYINPLLAEYGARIDNPRDFALRNRVLLLKTSQGIGLDISLGAIPFEEQVVSRSRAVEFLPGVSLRICSAEDLVVLKAFADRLQDWADVENVIKKQINALDWAYIDQQLGTLCQLKEAPEIPEKLSELKHRLS